MNEQDKTQSKPLEEPKVPADDATKGEEVKFNSLTNKEKILKTINSIAKKTKEIKQSFVDVPEEKPLKQTKNTSKPENFKTDEKYWEIKTAHSIAHDPLLSCLIILTRIEHNPFSPETLIAGLPLVDNKLTPELFVRAADRAGMSAQIVKRELGDVSQLVLPAVLLLRHKQACILVQINDEEKKAKVVQPETGQGEKWIDIEELDQDYTGYAIFTRPMYRFDTRTDENLTLKPQSWFWGVVANTWPLYIEVLLASFFINIFAIASSLFVMNVYDRVVPNGAIDTLWVLSLGILTVFTFDFIMKMLRGYFIDIAGKKTDVILSANIFEQMMGVKMAARPESVGNFANNLQQFESFRDFFTSTTIATLVDLPFVIFFLIIIGYIGGIVVIVPIVCIPIVLIVGLIIQGPLNRVVKESYRYSGQKHAMLIESLTGVETIKSVSAESPLQRKWEHVVGMAAKLGTRVRGLSSAAINFAVFVQQIAGVLVVILGVHVITDGKMTMGALIACTILTGRALAPLSQVAGLLTRYHQSLAALNSLDNVMKMPTDRLRGKTPLHRPVLRGDIEFKNVSFSYPKQAVPALSNISFKITAGEKVGIIGRIGSGKTTIEKLILGLYQTTEGSVLIDGIEIGQLDPANLRKNIGYVPQDVMLFYGTVKDNIVLGAPYVDDSEVLRAAKIAGVTDFVSKHPQGFDMPVGERGEKLSGGQRQAVTVARALIIDPPILVLDEPTNMMDNRTEEQFKAQLQQYSPHKTLILVTHKGSLLSLVDRIILMDGSKIIADGPRDLVLKALAEGKLHSPS
jgi:ATP-binding cassette subfamily C protein LapB